MVTEELGMGVGAPESVGTLRETQARPQLTRRRRASDSPSSPGDRGSIAKKTINNYNKRPPKAPAGVWKTREAVARLSPAAHKKSFVCAEVQPAAILDAKAGGRHRGRSKGGGYAREPPTPPIGTDAPVQGRGHLSAAKLKEQLACVTGPDGAGSGAGSSVSEAPASATVRAELGKARPGPRCRVLPGKGGTGKSRWRRRGVVGGRQKLDRLASLQMGGEKERLE